MSMNGPTGRDGEHDDVVVRKAEHGWVVRGENVSDLTSAMVLADLFAADTAADDDTRMLQAVDENGHPRRPSGGGNGQVRAAQPNPGKHGAAQHAPSGPPVQHAPGRPPAQHGDERPAAQHAPGRPPAQHGDERPAAQHAPGRPPAPRPPAGWSNEATGQTPRSVRENENGEAARLAVTVAQLEHALASRVRVEQAIGVLAERHRLRPRDAFDLLRGAARSRGRRVTELAQDVVASAANPLLRLPEELARKMPEQRQRGRSLRRARHAEQF
jgi:hypothetical protein